MPHSQKQQRHFTWDILDLTQLTIRHEEETEDTEDDKVMPLMLHEKHPQIRTETEPSILTPYPSQHYKPPSYVPNQATLPALHKASTSVSLSPLPSPLTPSFSDDFSSSDVLMRLHSLDSPINWSSEASIHSSHPSAPSLKDFNSPNAASIASTSSSSSSSSSSRIRPDTPYAHSGQQSRAHSFPVIQSQIPSGYMSDEGADSGSEGWTELLSASPLISDDYVPLKNNYTDTEHSTVSSTTLISSSSFSSSSTSSFTIEAISMNSSMPHPFNLPPLKIPNDHHKHLIQVITEPQKPESLQSPRSIIAVKPVSKAISSVLDPQSDGDGDGEPSLIIEEETHGMMSYEPGMNTNSDDDHESDAFVYDEIHRWFCRSMIQSPPPPDMLHIPNLYHPRGVSH